MSLSERKYKMRIRHILAERGLASHMNDTKWRELCEAAIHELPFPPAYQVKRVWKNTPEPIELEFAPFYIGDWGRTPEAQFDIGVEWIRISPRFSQHRGMLISPLIKDCTEKLRNLLTRLHLPYVEADSFFIVYGHSAGVEFASTMSSATE